MKFFITGGAGFIGSNLSELLIKSGNDVTVYDNCSTGKISFLEQSKKFKSFTFVNGDLLNQDLLNSAMQGHDFVFHLAANADVRFGINHPRKDLEQNIIATHNVLEAMRLNKINKIAFSSTGSIYGEAKVIPTPENYEIPIQTSLYGASKLSCEALIQAYCEGFKMQSWIFRFVSILGNRYTHGHVYDFYKNLLIDSNNLNVLGDGNQKKSYLDVNDCVHFMFKIIKKEDKQINIFNLGTDEYITVKQSIQIICNELNLNPKLNFSGGKQGWIGDNPFIWLDCRKMINAVGKPKLSIEEGVKKTIIWLSNNKWVFDHDNNT